MSSPIKWRGKQAFYISGTEHDEDTIRVVAMASQGNKERFLTLVLPTLCITYADMKFANDIGGVQKDYPDSQVYGSRYFDPPVILNGEAEIKKFTWIRGANQVEIGPKETLVKWPCWRTLVISRLRIKEKEKVKTLLSVPEVTVTVAQPFVATIKQYADGRHVGGVQLTKRHPDWKPEPVSQRYDLWVRVIDGTSGRALPKVRVNLFTRDAASRSFTSEASWYTNELGIVDVSGLPCSDKKLVTIESATWRSQTWRFRPLPGQSVRRTFKLWKSKQIKSSYKWQARDTLKSIAALSGTKEATILKMNNLRSASAILSGRSIKIPSLEAIYRVEARDSLERVAKYFCYSSAKELAAANRLTQPYHIYQDQGLRLPGWRFFQARPDDLFAKLDEQFGLPKGWSRPAQRTLHDNPARTYEHETVAVPTREFIGKHKLRRWY